MMHAVQFYVSEHITIQNNDKSIDYGIFSPLWVDYMINNQVIAVDYSSTYSELASEEESQYNHALQGERFIDIHQSPIFIPSKSQLKLQYHTYASISHKKSLQQFAGLVGGSFVNTYLPILPIRIPFSNSEDNDIFFYHIPRERLNAEMLSRWLTTLPPSLRTVAMKNYQLNKTRIHQSDWYGIRIQSNLNMITQNSTHPQNVYEAKISFSLFFKEALLSHEDVDTNTAIIPETTSLTSTGIFRHFKVIVNSQNQPHIDTITNTCMGSCSNDNNFIVDTDRANDLNKHHVTIAPMFVRKIINKESSEFQIQSTINSHNMPNSITEGIPSHYQIDLSSYQYRFCSEGACSCSSEWKHVSQLGEVAYLDSRCQFVENYRHSVHANEDNHNRCERAVIIIPFAQHQNMFFSTQLLQLRFNARKIFVSSGLLPPDASYGAVVPPLVVGICNSSNNSSSGCDLITSPSMLITYPIPDRTMPYNVLTMVSTLFAFILGSMLNLLLKKWRMRCAITDEKFVEASTFNITNEASLKDPSTKNETHIKAL